MYPTRVALCITAINLSLAVPAVHAASGTWTGGSATPNWGFLANWVSNTEASGTGFTATFGNTFNNGYSINLNTNRTIGNITLNNNAASDFEINQINGAVFNFDVSSGSPTVTITDAARTLSINVPIGGSDGMTKTGPGSLVLSATNNYTGATLITEGTLSLTGNRSANMGGTLDIGGTDAVLNLAGDLPMGGSQFRPGNATGTGTVNQTAGAVTFTGGNNLTLGTNSATQGFYNLSGGSFTTTTTSIHRGVIIGVNNSCDGTFNLSGTGVLDVTSGSSLQITRSENVTANGATGTFVQTGGTATIAELRIGGLNATTNTNQTATLDLSGGTFSAADFSVLSGGNGSVSTINISGTADVTLPDFPTTRGTGATATVTFDGGTLRNLVASTTFMEGLTDALIKAGGMNIDTTAGAATISQDLSEDGGSPGGGLTKTGAFDLILAGTNTYTGATNANEGSIKFSTAGSSVSDVAVADGARAGALVAADDGQWVNSGDLTCANNSAVVIDYGSSTPSTTVAPISVDTLNVGTNIGTRIEGDLVPALAVSQAYPLITWTTGPADASAFTTILTGGLSGTFSVSSNTLYLTVTSNTVGQPISWNTGDGTWDEVTSNWVDANLASVTYVDPLDAVLFGDASGATGSPIVTLNDVFSPEDVTMNSTSRDYTITGTGGIGGLGALLLDAANTGTLTLATANSYTGATTIDGGTLQLGNGGSDGSLNPGSPISVAAGATFAVNQDDAVAQGTDFSGVAIDGAGGFSQAGSGTTVLNAANTFSGPTAIAGGTLQIDGTGSLGGGSYAGDIAIAGGAALQYSSSTGQTLSGIISGAGSLTKDTGGSTLTLEGANTYTGDTTLSTGTLALGASEVIADSSAVIQSGGTIRTADGVVETLHSLTASGGTLLIGTTSTSGSADITLLNNSEVNDIQIGITSILRLAAGVTLTQTGSGTTSQLGPGDTLTFDVGAGGLADMTGDINTGDGDGALNKIGAGTLRLTSPACKWGGGTVIENGTVEFDTIANINNASSLGDADTADVLQIGSNATAATLRMIGTDSANSTNRAVQLGDAGGTVDIVDAAQILTIGGIVSDASTSGSLTKTGDGTLLLSGPNTYTGPTLVSAGTLQFSTDGSGASDITASANAAAGPLVAADDAQFVNSGDLTLGNDGILLVDYGSTTPSTTVAPMQVDNFGLGTNPVVILDAASISSLLVGQTYPLVTWTGSGPADGSAFSLVSHRGLLTGTFSVAANTLSVTIGSNTPSVIAWNAGDGIWDTATSNWVDGSLAATTYVDPLDGVLFGDAGGASGNPLITLDSIFSPVSVTMNSTSHDYTIDGIGGIAGTGPLTLDGANTRTLTLSTANDTFDGDITVNGGTLVGAGAFSGSGGVRVFGAGSSARTVTVNTGGTLQFDSGNIFTGNFSSNSVPSLVIDGGTVTNGGIATNNALGLVTLNDGTLTATTGSSSGYGSYNLNNTVTSTGTSLISSTALEPVTLSAAAGTTTIFDVQSGTLTISAELGEVTASGDERSSGLVKAGAGILRLSAMNSYSDATTIDGGMLEVMVAQAMSGGLAFGAAAGNTTTGALDLSSASASFAGASLAQNNSPTANTVTVGAAQTLTLSGGLTMGYDAGGGSGATQSDLTVSGSGSFVVTGSTLAISVNQAGTNQGYWSAPTLDVSGLGAFSADVTNFNVGVGTTTHGPGTLLLSDTANTIIATNLKVGDTGSNNGRGVSTLLLGTGTNVIQTDTLTIGRGKSSGNGVVKFASQDVGPGTVTIADAAGTGPTDITLGNAYTVATGGGAVGTLDLRGHVATVTAGTLLMGQTNANSNVASTNGVIHFDSGTFTVDTLQMGLKTGNSTGSAKGTINVGGGDFTVDTSITFGSQTGNGSSQATLNLTGGTFTSNTDILSGGGIVTSTINLSGGLLDLVGNDIGTIGEPVVLNAESGTLQNVAAINGTGGLTKTTADTLVLTGTNGYTGATVVSEGTLSLINGSHASPITANNAASLGFTLDSPTTSTESVTFDAGSTVKITGTPTLASYTLMTASSFAGIAPVLDAPIAGYALTVDGGTTLKLVQAAGYASWAATNAGGQGPDLDWDGDGMQNGVEYFMNAAAGFTANPQLDGSGTITWPNGGNIPASEYGTQFVVQTSSDLVNWNDVLVGDLDTNTDGPGGSLTYTLTGPGPRFVRLQVTPN
ncbi:hypothetical protein Hhel01_02172 [Haloferula helveola]